MEQTGWRVRGAAVLALALAVFLVWWYFPDRSERDLGLRERGTATAPQPTVRQRVQSGTLPPPTLDEAPHRGEQRTLSLADIWDGTASLSGVSITWDGGAAETTPEGSFCVPAVEGLILSVGDERVFLAYPDRPFGGAGDDGVVRVWRSVRVAGRVAATDRDPFDAPCSVVGAPTVSRPGEWIPAQGTPGSLTWLQAHTPDLAEFPAAVSGGRFEIDVPVCSSLTLVASASGHLAASLSLDTRAGRSELHGVVLVLQPKRKVHVRLTDDAGDPIRGAVVEYFCVRRGPIGTLTAGAEILVHGAANTGLAMKDYPSRGTAEVSHKVDARTDADGSAFLDQPAIADTEFIVVRTRGKRTEIVRLDDPRWAAGTLDIAMQPIRPVTTRYRFLADGVPLTHVSVAVLEEVEGFHAGGPPTPVGREGYFSSDSFVPGRTYWVLVLSDGQGPVYSGRVAFDEEEDIEISDLRRGR